MILPWLPVFKKFFNHKAKPELRICAPEAEISRFFEPYKWKKRPDFVPSKTPPFFDLYRAQKMRFVPQARREIDGRS
jgi:hypothetical protein